MLSENDIMTYGPFVDLRCRCLNFLDKRLCLSLYWSKTIMLDEQLTTAQFCQISSIVPMHTTASAPASKTRPFLHSIEKES